jgi:hypothetical protein
MLAGASTFAGKLRWDTRADCVGKVIWNNGVADPGQRSRLRSASARQAPTHLPWAIVVRPYGTFSLCCAVVASLPRAVGRRGSDRPTVRSEERGERRAKESEAKGPGTGRWSLENCSASFFAYFAYFAVKGHPDSTKLTTKWQRRRRGSDRRTGDEYIFRRSGSP